MNFYLLTFPSNYIHAFLLPPLLSAAIVFLSFSPPISSSLPLSRRGSCLLNALLKVMNSNELLQGMQCTISSFHPQFSLAGVRKAFNSIQQHLNFSLTNSKVVRHFNEPIITLSWSWPTCLWWHHISPQTNNHISLFPSMLSFEEVSWCAWYCSVFFPPHKRSGWSISTAGFASIVKPNCKSFSDL